MSNIYEDVAVAVRYVHAIDPIFLTPANLASDQILYHELPHRQEIDR